MNCFENKYFSITREHVDSSKEEGFHVEDGHPRCVNIVLKPIKEDGSR